MSDLEKLDHWLFQKINADWTNSLFDSFFPIYTNILKFPIVAYFILPLLLFLWIFRQKSKAAKVICSTLIIVGVTDKVGYSFLKSQFERARPNHLEIGAIVRVPYAPKSYSFPSNHALNSMAIANNIAFYHPTLRVGLYIYAALMGYSRIYVGVHFPWDVIAGGIIGLLIAIFIRWILLKMIPWFKPH